MNITCIIHLDIMRPDPLLSGLQSVAHNINHQQTDLRLFEFGRFYEGGEAFTETEFLTIFMTGAQGTASWKSESESNSDFYAIKKWVEGLFHKLNIGSYQSAESESSYFDYGQKFHRGPSTMVEFGKLNKAIRRKADIDNEVFYASFNLKSILKAAKKANFTTSPISKFPSTTRDLALVIDESVKFEEILAISKKTEKKLISDVSLFDIYKNDEQLGESKKSYAVKFTFQDFHKTLKDKDVDKIMQSLIRNFEEKLGAVIRS